MNRHAIEIIEAAREIRRNADRIKMCESAYATGFMGEQVPIHTREKVLIELRHDLEGALKAVKALEDAAQ